jgi:hypothetical protein
LNLSPRARVGLTDPLACWPFLLSHLTLESRSRGGLRRQERVERCLPTFDLAMVLACRCAIIVKRLLQDVRGHHMPRSIALFAALSVALALGTPARGQGYSTGDGYYTQCKGEESVEGVKCLAYLKGLLDAGKHLNGLPIICPPPDTKLGDFNDALLKFIKDYPYQRQKSTAELLWLTLSQSYPCSRR